MAGRPAGPLLDGIDGLCIPGGPDIHPRHYGAIPHEMLGPTEGELDMFERALVWEALERGPPLLGICRRAQMITDSRSFMSYPRHEYFRRTLCNLIGRDIENGEIPNDEKLVGPMIKNICCANAKNYLAFPGVK